MLTYRLGSLCYARLHFITGQIFFGASTTRHDAMLIAFSKAYKLGLIK